MAPELLNAYGTSGIELSYDAPTERNVLFGGGTYGIARRSASLSHRLSYDAPLVRTGWNEETTEHTSRPAAITGSACLPSEWLRLYNAVIDRLAGRPEV